MDDSLSNAELLTLVNQKVVALHAEGRLEEAREIAEEAVPLAREIHGPGDPQVASCLTTLAVIHTDMGHPELAVPLVEEALEIRREALGSHHPKVASSLHDLAVIQQALGDLPTAERLAEEAAEIRRGTEGERDPKVAGTLTLLGELFEQRGAYPEAERALSEALEIYREAPGEHDVGVASVLNNLGLVHAHLGNRVEAERLYREALTIRRRTSGERDVGVGRMLLNLGSLLREMGDSTASAPLVREGLEILRESLGPRHPDVAHALMTVAQQHSQAREYGQARALLEEALRILREALGAEHLFVGTALNELALVHRAEGEFAAALPLAEQGLAIRRAALGDRHPTVAVSLDNLGIILADMGSYEAAEPLMREALEIFRQRLGPRHPDLATNLLSLALVHAATDRDAEALRLMDEAIRIHDQMLGDMLSSGSERRRTIFLFTLEMYTGAYLSLVRERFPTDQDATNRAMDLVLRRKAVGTEALAAQRDAILTRGDPELLASLGELRNLRTRIAQKTIEGPGPEGVDEHLRLLSEWNETREGLEEDLAAAVPELRLEPLLREADRAAAASALPEQSVLVEFARFVHCDFRAVRARGEPQWKPSRYVAFVLRADDPDGVRMVDLGEAGPIDELVARYREAVTGDGASRQARGNDTEPIRPGEPEPRAGRALRAAVFDPLVTHLEGRTRLLLAPSGDLSRLPFEVLPTDEGGRLIDGFVVSYLGTGRDALRFTLPAPSPPGPPLVAAAPDFDLAEARSDGPPPGRRSEDLPRSGLRFRPLSGTEEEGRAIGGMLGVSPWLGDGVLDTRLKASPRPRILHLATHGFFLPDQEQAPVDGDVLPRAGDGSQLGPLRGAGMENPLLRSGLALAGANTFLDGRSPPAQAEDGILTAEDVSGLDLVGTEMVVLSACETGLGEIFLGEGVFGLRRAFVLAGARTLVMCLWKVPDGPSAELMRLFYENLKAGMGRADALRDAQLRMADIYPPPWFWGAFICQGDPGPLDLEPVRAGAMTGPLEQEV